MQVRWLTVSLVCPAAFSAPRVPAAPAGLVAGRLQAVQALAHLAGQAAALRARTRRAVTAVATMEATSSPAQHQHLAVNGQGGALPRFLRRAVADAVEKSESDEVCLPAALAARPPSRIWALLTTLCSCCSLARVRARALPD